MLPCTPHTLSSTRRAQGDTEPLGVLERDREGEGEVEGEREAALEEEALLVRLPLPLALALPLPLLLPLLLLLSLLSLLLLLSHSQVSLEGWEVGVAHSWPSRALARGVAVE